ncbi:hypothetical protein H4R18_005320 [Coemansia javaensis]|uniref:Uncharacterized protein n=1 Tax=Coemansia javaensis TaxID=2761396 RepID=A0A9W8H2B6_9FUNG|nr:hypothetical protein H4R18_005320 [Coemansia javaensis]
MSVHSSDAPSRPRLLLSSGPASSDVPSSVGSLHSGSDYFPALPHSPTTPDHPVLLPGIARFSPGHNLEGSWLDLDSDDDDDAPRRAATLARAPRKNSGSSVKELRSTLSGIRELTHRGSMHIRKLTVKIVR